MTSTILSPDEPDDGEERRKARSALRRRIRTGEMSGDELESLARLVGHIGSAVEWLHERTSGSDMHKAINWEATEADYAALLRVTEQAGGVR